VNMLEQLVAATVPALSAAKKTLRMAALSFLRGYVVHLVLIWRTVGARTDSAVVCVCVCVFPFQRVLPSAATLFHVLATDSKKATPHGAMAIQIAQVLATALPNQTDAKAVMFALVTLGEIVRTSLPPSL